MASETILAAYSAWVAADKAWSAELERVFGRDAGDARYDRRGVSTAELKLFHAAKDRAKEAYYRVQP